MRQTHILAPSLPRPGHTPCEPFTCSDAYDIKKSLRLSMGYFVLFKDFLKKRNPGLSAPGPLKAS